MAKVLITDSLFFFDEHVQKLRDAGYEVERLDKSDASEAELVEAIKGKVGYLLGGIEQVTEKVIDAADSLKAIGFTGIDYKGLIPAWDYATKKGIAITNTPSGPTNEVAEWAITAALVMNRHFLELGRVNKDKKFMVTPGLEGQTIGIVGLGRIGTRIAELVQSFRPGAIYYSSLHRHEDLEQELGVTYLELSEVLSMSDVVFLCVDGSAKGYFGEEQLNQMKKDSLLVNITHPGVIQEGALLNVLKEKHIRAISDHAMRLEGFNNLSFGQWYCMNVSSTVTCAGAKLMSDMATDSLLNILERGSDQYLVNPDYTKYL